MDVNPPYSIVQSYFGRYSTRTSSRAEVLSICDVLRTSGIVDSTWPQCPTCVVSVWGVYHGDLVSSSHSCPEMLPT